MPKLILPKSDRSGTIEVREYSRGNPRHLRALSKYLFDQVHGQTVMAFVRALIPGLTEEQLTTIDYTRLRDLSQMDLTQAEEIYYMGKGDE